MATDDIKRFVPQREPVLMVDRLLDVDGDIGRTELTVGRGNMFLDRYGSLLEIGLIEHIAQSASAIAGYRVVAKGGADAPIGMIAEVKHFKCYRLPVIGDVLTTTVTFGFEFAGVTLVSGKSCVGGDVVAEVKMKIFMK